MTRFGKLFSIVAACFSFVTAQSVSNPPAGSDTAMKTVSAGKFDFSYKVEGENLVAKLSCPSAGWVAVGFNPKNVMKNAFCVMGAVVDGKPVISEEFGAGMFEHKPILSLGGKCVVVASDVVVENGVTTLSFTMPLSTKDGMHADLVVGKKVKLMLAAGGSNDFTKKHKKKTEKTITL